MVGLGAASLRVALHRAALLVVSLALHLVAWTPLAGTALVGFTSAAQAQDNPNCPRPPGVPPGARYSCRTHTQTQQSGEPATRHPGGSPGRGTGGTTVPPSSLPAPPSTATPGTGNASLHCQLDERDICRCGPRQGTGRNRPCRHELAAQAPPVFHYIYFNGINTPMGAGTSGRGTYLWDFHMIANNLLDLHHGRRSGHPHQAQDGVGYQQPVRVAHELDRMVDIGHNFSGKDSRARDAVREFCAGSASRRSGMDELRTLMCDGIGITARWLDHVRGDSFFGMALGDIVECYMQAHGVKVHEGPQAGRFKPGGNIAWTAELDEVKRVVAYIRDTVARERQGPGAAAAHKSRNHFIVIGHSQGNFFTEAVGWRLMQEDRALFNERVALLAFASPTSYDAIDDLAWRAKRFRWVTRHDDAIVALGKAPLPGQKPPLKPNATALWPWPVEHPITMLMDVITLGPPPECLCPDPNNALFMPAMNSHLLDNYLTDPPMTEAGHLLHKTVLERMKWQRSPPTVAVLGQARRSLLELKAGLLGVQVP